MDVLVHILQGGKGSQAFDVDVAIILGREPRVVWNDPLVANHVSVDFVRPTVIGASIQGVALVVDAGV